MQLFIREGIQIVKIENGLSHQNQVLFNVVGQVLYVSARNLGIRVKFSHVIYESSLDSR